MFFIYIYLELCKELCNHGYGDGCCQPTSKAPNGKSIFNHIMTRVALCKYECSINRQTADFVHHQVRKLIAQCSTTVHKCRLTEALAWHGI